MSFKQRLVDKLEAQLKQEAGSKRFYQALVSKLSDKPLVAGLKEIIADEAEHVSIVASMLSIVKSYDGKAEIREKTSKDTAKLEKGLVGANAVLVVVPLKKEAELISNILGKLISKNKVMYVSYGKLSKHMVKILKEQNTDTDEIKFIDCSQYCETEKFCLNPSDLTNLSIVLDQTLKRTETSIALVDNLSNFLTYHDADTTCRFVASINDKFRLSGGLIIWFTVSDGSDRKLDAKIQPFFDKILKF